MKSKYENSTIKFVITDSNASLFTSEFATYLTGRVLKIRLNSEIDFLIENTLIQVAYNIEDDKTKSREFKAFDEFKKSEYATLLITFNTHEKINDIKIMSFD